MRSFWTLLVAAVFCLAGTAQAQQLQPFNAQLTFNPTSFVKSNITSAGTESVTCALDTNQYTLAKATGLAALSLNNVTSAYAGAQYYPAPGPVTISGLDFFAWSTAGFAVDVIISVYAAGSDSLPTGAPLVSDTVTIDTTFGTGSLADLNKQAIFDTPLTIDSAFMIVVENNSANNIALLSNDWNAGDGGGLYLAALNLGGTWVQGNLVSVAGVPFDADWLVYPWMSFDIDADFTATASGCVDTGTTVSVTANPSAFLTSPFYSFAAFLGLAGVQHDWAFGDGATDSDTAASSHTYNTQTDVTITLTDTLFGWTRNCVDTESELLVACCDNNMFPYTYDFENEAQCPTGTGSSCTLVGDWQNVGGDDLDWLADAGGTTSSLTGPPADHTSGTSTGKYLYVETSGIGYPNKTALLESSCFDFSGLTAPKMSFWYHMFGSSMGDLHIDVLDENGVWNLDIIPAFTDNIDLWQQLTVDLTAFAGQSSVKVRFRFISGTSFSSDVAIDDIEIFEPAPFDLEAISVSTSVTGCAGTGTDTVKLCVKNAGTLTVPAGETGTLGFTFGGSTEIDTFTIPVNILPGDTFCYSFSTTIDLSSPGTDTLVAFVYEPLGLQDPSNDTTSNIINIRSLVSSFPYMEDFEGGASGWTTGGTSNWALGTPAKGIINSAASGVNSWVVASLTANYGLNEQTWVQGPCFDFSSVSEPWIDMNVWWEAEFSWDGTVLQSSIDNGATWQNVGSAYEECNWYTDNSINAAPGGSQDGWSGRNSTSNGSDGWVLARHELTGLGGMANVNLRVIFGSDNSVIDEGFAFDDVKIYDGFECYAPDSLLATNIKSNSALLNWAPTCYAQNYLVRGRPVGSSTWEYRDTTATSKNVYRLGSGVEWEWQVAAICDTVLGDTSAWSALSTFTTLCEAPDSVWTTNVDTGSATLNWNAVAGAQGYIVRGRPVGPGPLKRWAVPPGRTFQNVFGLNSGTSYQWVVKAICDNGAKSMLSVVDTFTTASSARFGNWNSGNAEVTVYPNPFTNTTTVYFDQPMEGFYNVTLTDLSGRQVWLRNNMTDQTFTISRDALPSGVYLLEISGAEIVRLKLVIE